MANFCWVCLGGAIGSGARYLVSGLALAALGPWFPFGTLLVNAVGSFLICIIMHLGMVQMVPPSLRLFLTTGIMGGFTTYSTFNFETLQYAEKGAYGLAAVNVASTVVVCLVAGVLGTAVGRWLVPG